jgi:ketosteroid isomerase-like protein
MRRLNRVLGLICCLVAVSGVAHSQVTGADSVVRAREVAFANTMAERNLDSFRSFLSDEAVFFAGETVLRGADAIVAGWSGYFEGADAPFSWSPDVVVVLESGELALSSGPVLDSAGVQVGRFNSIWRKESDGQWRVVFDRGS